MGKVTLRLIHNRQGRGSSQKEVSVELEFCCNRKRKYVATSVKVKPNEWSEKTKSVIKRKDSALLNALLDAWKEKANKVLCKLVDEGLEDLSCVPRLFNEIDKDEMTFVEYCEKRRNERKVSEHTKKRYDVFIRFLKDWGKIVSFSEVCVSKIREMDEHLHRQGKETCTIYDYHKILKLFVNDAVVDGYIEENPYKRLPFKIARGEKQYVDYLTEEQFDSIKRLEIKTPHLEQVRDLFLFQCYTGLAYSDLMTFDLNTCTEVDGRLFYHSKRTKTDTDFVFLLLDQAVAILKKYGNKLPKLSNQKYNDYLKVIGVLVGVPKLHTHMGRGTAATLFLSKGMPINVVQKVLGHKTLKQTIRYARTLNKDVAKAFDNIEGLM